MGMGPLRQWTRVDRGRGGGQSLLERWGMVLCAGSASLVCFIRTRVLVWVGQIGYINHNGTVHNARGDFSRRRVSRVAFGFASVPAPSEIGW